jgi:PAS domain S-box-containing protein
MSGQEKVKIMAENMANKLVMSSQQLFLEVYNNSPVAYLIVGKFGDIISANTATARLLGVSTESLIKKDLFSFIDTASEEHKAILKQKFQQGIVVSDEEVKVPRGKSFAWTMLSIFQFSSSDGRKLSLVTFVDITKQKEIDAAKKEFVSLASHQLRTPISGMRWSAELLLMDGVESLSTQQKRYIDRLLSSIHRMSSLVDDFLQVSRFELGTRVLKQEQINLEELFEEVLGDQAEVVTGKRLSVNKEYDDSLSKISTDAGMLRMIVTNLYVNAVKYSRVGGEITISYCRKGGELEIEVKDTGMGIPISEQQRVFTKIFRATNAVKEVPDGTGLGLYIVDKAVQSLKGRISFSSTENIGTTFTVVLPLNLLS